MEKVFKVADIRKFEQQVTKGDISYSRMVELMNEMAYTHYVVNKNCNKHDASGMCEHPIKSLMFWNTGEVECSICGYKTVPF